jgi:ABC-type glutathione transport system ATPase component
MRDDDHDDGDTIVAGVPNIPNLLLWDNFLTTIPDKTGKQEIIRQLLRLWRETTNTMVVVSTTRGYSELDDKHVTCRIRLEAAAAEAVQENEQQQHGYTATLLGSSSKEQVSFTIGTVGILS